LVTMKFCSWINQQSVLIVEPAQQEFMGYCATI